VMGIGKGSPRTSSLPVPVPGTNRTIGLGTGGIESLIDF
jgi:hypothetical protein